MDWVKLWFLPMDPEQCQNVWVFQMGWRSQDPRDARDHAPWQAERLCPHWQLAGVQRQTEQQHWKHSCFLTRSTQAIQPPRSTPADTQRSIWAAGSCDQNVGMSHQVCGYLPWPCSPLQQHPDLLPPWHHHQLHPHHLPSILLPMPPGVHETGPSKPIHLRRSLQGDQEIQNYPMENKEVILSIKVEVKPVQTQQNSFNSGTSRNSFQRKPCSSCSFKGFDDHHYLLSPNCLPKKSCRLWKESMHTLHVDFNTLLMLTANPHSGVETLKLVARDAFMTEYM